MADDFEKIEYNTSGWSAIHDANVDKLNDYLAGLIAADNSLGDTHVADAAALTAETITDSTGGSAGQTLAAISGSGADSDINNNFASLCDDLNKSQTDVSELWTQFNALLAALRITGGCGVLDDAP